MINIMDFDNIKKTMNSDFIQKIFGCPMAWYYKDTSITYYMNYPPYITDFIYFELKTVEDINALVNSKDIIESIIIFNGHVIVILKTDTPNSVLELFFEVKFAGQFAANFDELFNKFREPIKETPIETINSDDIDKILNSDSARKSIGHRTTITDFNCHNKSFAYYMECPTQLEDLNFFELINLTEIRDCVALKDYIISIVVINNHVIIIPRFKTQNEIFELPFKRKINLKYVKTFNDCYNTFVKVDIPIIKKKITHFVDIKKAMDATPLRSTIGDPFTMDHDEVPIVFYLHNPLFMRDFLFFQLETIDEIAELPTLKGFIDSIVIMNDHILVIPKYQSQCDLFETSFGRKIKIKRATTFYNCYNEFIKNATVPKSHCPLTSIKKHDSVSKEPSEYEQMEHEEYIDRVEHREYIKNENNVKPWRPSSTSPHDWNKLYGYDSNTSTNNSSSSWRQRYGAPTVPYIPPRNEFDYGDRRIIYYYVNPKFIKNMNYIMFPIEKPFTSEEMKEYLGGNLVLDPFVPPEIISTFFFDDEKAVALLKPSTDITNIHDIIIDSLGICAIGHAENFDTFYPTIKTGSSDINRQTPITINSFDNDFFFDPMAPKKAIPQNSISQEEEMKRIREFHEQSMKNINSSPVDELSPDDFEIDLEADATDDADTNYQNGIHYVAIRTTKDSDFFHNLFVFEMTMPVEIVQYEDIVIITADDATTIQQVIGFLKKLFNMDDPFKINGKSNTLGDCFDEVDRKRNSMYLYEKTLFEDF